MKKATICSLVVLLVLSLAACKQDPEGLARQSYEVAIAALVTALNPQKAEAMQKKAATVGKKVAALTPENRAVYEAELAHLAVAGMSGLLNIAGSIDADGAFTIADALASAVTGTSGQPRPARATRTDATPDTRLPSPDDVPSGDDDARMAIDATLKAFGALTGKAGIGADGKAVKSPGFFSRVIAALFGGGGKSNKSGGLTITGLPDSPRSNFSQLFVFPSGTSVSLGFPLGSVIAEADSRGQDFPLYVWRNMMVTSTRWTGSGKFEVIVDPGFDDDDDDGGLYYATVNFNNGNATIPFSSFTKQGGSDAQAALEAALQAWGGAASGGPGTLTITGMPNESRISALFVFEANTDISTSSILDAILDAPEDNSSTLEATDIEKNGNVVSLMSSSISTYGTTYTVSGRRPVLLTVDDPNSDVDYLWATVNFANGSATVPFNNFTAVTD